MNHALEFASTSSDLVVEKTDSMIGQNKPGAVSLQHQGCAVLALD